MGYFKELSILLDENDEAIEKIMENNKKIKELVSNETKVENETVVEEKKNTISLEDLRSFLGQMSRDGMTESVKQLLKRYGADKLSNLSPDNYEAVYLDAEDIKNGR